MTINKMKVGGMCMKTLSVYIHIPFCVHKCNYCDFLSAPATEAARKQYVEALKREIMQESLQYKEYSVDTVFFGGGTPSILKGEEIAECMETLRQYLHQEVTYTHTVSYMLQVHTQE